jgi:hypothetical protein
VLAERFGEAVGSTDPLAPLSLTTRLRHHGFEPVERCVRYFLGYSTRLMVLKVQLDAVAVSIGVGAEPKAVLRSITVSGLKASCEQQQLSAKECQQVRSGYISGAYDALVAAQIMRNDWGAMEARAIGSSKADDQATA